MKIKPWFMRQRDTVLTPLQKTTGIFLALALFAGFFALSVLRLGLHFDFSVLLEYQSRILQGFYTTLALSVASLILSLIIGLLTALGNHSRVIVLSYLCNIYVQFIRGTPLIMQIYLFFYVIGTAWGVDNRLVAGIIILSLFEGAYISEIIRGGLDSISSTQHEAAAAVGLDSGQTLRLVVLPQLIKSTLPALTGQFASIIKDSSLLSIISVIELTQTMREITAARFTMFECYMALGLLYLCLTLPISLFTRRLERKYRYES